jgi:hypothetical protein
VLAGRGDSALLTSACDRVSFPPQEELNLHWEEVAELDEEGRRRLRFAELHYNAAWAAWSLNEGRLAAHAADNAARVVVIGRELCDTLEGETGLEPWTAIRSAQADCLLAHLEGAASSISTE